MASKCTICAKSAYAQESVTIDGRTWHKTCFKCTTCSLRLDLQTYKFGFGDTCANAYCKKCVPVLKATDIADRLDISSALARPKVGLVNDQVRGELAGQKPNEDIASIAISGRIHAPRQGVINEQIRGELAGQKPHEDISSMAISSRIHAPRQGVINEQIRGELAGQKPNEDISSIAISSRIHAPRVSVVNEQIRGELAGQKPNEDISSMAISSRLHAPRVSVVNEQIRGELAGQKSLEDTNSLAMSARLNAPRIDTVNNQIRGVGRTKMRLSDVVASSTDNAEKELETSIGEVRAFLATLESKEVGLRKAQQRRSMIRTASEEERVARQPLKTIKTDEPARPKPIDVTCVAATAATEEVRTPRENMTEAIPEVPEQMEEAAQHADSPSRHRRTASVAIPQAHAPAPAADESGSPAADRRESAVLQRLQLELVVQKHLATMYLRELERLRDEKEADRNELERLRVEINTHDQLAAAQELYDCPQELLSASNNYGYTDEPIYESIDEIYAVPQNSLPPTRRPSAYAY